MNFRFAPLAIALAASVTLAAGAPALAAEPHQHASADAHQHGTGGPAGLALNHGKKWATDEPLRKGMTAIRTAVAEKQEGIHRGTLMPADYQALGATVETQVATIVAECKLEPAADANLHLIVADLVAGADAMQAKSKAKPAAGAAKAVQALNRYGQYFDHPGWQPLR